MDTIKKLENKLHQECRYQTLTVYSAVGIALSRHWGWGTARIERLFDLTSDVWHECGETNDVSMLEMLEQETGIELILQENGKSWHNLAFLNGQIRRYNRSITRYQWIAMRQQQIQWLGTTIQACIYLALHRREGFGPERIKRIMDQMTEVREEYGNKMQSLIDACKAETGVNVVEKFKAEVYSR